MMMVILVTPLFQISTCSLTRNFEDLEYLLKATNTNFDKIAVSETRLLKNTKIVKNIIIPNFSFEFTLTESTAGGTLLYIADHLPYESLREELFWINIYRNN